MLNYIDFGGSFLLSRAMEIKARMDAEKGKKPQEHTPFPIIAAGLKWNFSLVYS